MEELKIILLTAYFTTNAYLAGHMDSGYDNKIVWWKTLLLIWFAIPYFIFMALKYTIDNVLSDHGWYQDLKFWFQLNLTTEWKGLKQDKINTLGRAVDLSNHRRPKSQWDRIKKKYNYDLT